MLLVKRNRTVGARVMDIVLLSATIHNDAFSGVHARLRPCGTTGAEEGTTRTPGRLDQDRYRKTRARIKRRNCGRMATYTCPSDATVCAFSLRLNCAA